MYYRIFACIFLALVCKLSATIDADSASIDPAFDKAIKIAMDDFRERHGLEEQPTEKPKEKAFDWRAEYNKVRDAFVKEIEQNYGLVCTAKDGRLLHSVDVINIQFDSKKKSTIKKARKVEVKAIERLVAMINENEQLRPYLAEYPFPASRCFVGVSFIKKHGTFYSDGDLACVFQAKGNIYYDTKNNKTSKLEPIYEDALKIVQAQS